MTDMPQPRRNKHYPKTGKRGTSQAFGLKMREILAEGGEERRAIIAWDASGDSFSLFDEDALVAEVLPHYFNGTKFTSFRRQLCQYEFRDLPADGSSTQFARRFAHDFFKRDQPELMHPEEPCSKGVAEPGAPTIPCGGRLAQDQLRARGGFNLGLSPPL